MGLVHIINPPISTARSNCPSVAPLRYLIVQLFVQLADLLLVLLPLLLRNVNHDGGGDGAGAAGAADVKNRFLVFRRHQGNLL